MILRYTALSRYPRVFQSLTGLRLSEFDALATDVVPQITAARHTSLARLDRKRTLGGGEHPVLAERDQLLLTVVWLRVYPTHEVLGYLFGVSDSTVSRTVGHVTPVLAHAGRDTMRLPDPGKKHRRTLAELLRDTPELMVIVDSFEQRVYRAKDRTDADT